MNAVEPVTHAEMDARWREARARLWSGAPASKPKTAMPPARRAYAPQIVREIEERPATNPEIVVHRRDWLLIRPAKIMRGGASGDVPKEVLVPLPLWVPISREVCREFGVTMAEIKSPRRDKRLVIPRQKIAWRLKRETPMTVAAIGKVINRDHTTVLYSVARYEAALAAATEARRQ